MTQREVIGLIPAAGMATRIAPLPCSKELYPVSVFHGSPYTLDAAYPFVKDADIALGYPDIIFEPEDAFVPLLAKLREDMADVVMGLMPADRPETTDMVEFGPQGRVRRIVIKQPDIGLKYNWVMAVWQPSFAQFMHNFLAHVPTRNGEREWHVGNVIQAAIDASLAIDTVPFPQGGYADVGVPEVLEQAHQGRLAML